MTEQITSDVNKETSSEKPEPCRQILLLHQQVEQQFTRIVVRFLDVLKVLSFFDRVDNFLCIRTLDVATLHTARHVTITPLVIPHYSSFTTALVLYT